MGYQCPYIVPPVEVYIQKLFRGTKNPQIKNINSENSKALIYLRHIDKYVTKYVLRMHQRTSYF